MTIHDGATAFYSLSAPPLATGGLLIVCRSVCLVPKPAGERLAVVPARARNAELGIPFLEVVDGLLARGGLVLLHREGALCLRRDAQPVPLRRVCIECSRVGDDAVG